MAVLKDHGCDHRRPDRPVAHLCHRSILISAILDSVFVVLIVVALCLRRVPLLFKKHAARFERPLGWTLLAAWPSG